MPLTEHQLLTLLGPSPSDEMLLENLTAYFSDIGWHDVVGVLNRSWPEYRVFDHE